MPSAVAVVSQPSDASLRATQARRVPSFNVAVESKRMLVPGRNSPRTSDARCNVFVTDTTCDSAISISGWFEDVRCITAWPCKSSANPVGEGGRLDAERASSGRGVNTQLCRSTLHGILAAASAATRAFDVEEPNSRYCTVENSMYGEVSATCKTASACEARVRVRPGPVCLWGPWGVFWFVSA